MRALVLFTNNLCSESAWSTPPGAPWRRSRCRVSSPAPPTPWGCWPTTSRAPASPASPSASPPSQRWTCPPPRQTSPPGRPRPSPSWCGGTRRVTKWRNTNSTIAGWVDRRARSEWGQRELWALSSLNLIIKRERGWRERRWWATEEFSFFFSTFI